MLPLSPAAVGSAWSAFLRPFAIRSPTLTQPVPLPLPPLTSGHELPLGFPIGVPVLTSRRYSALPAFGALGPRLGIEFSMSGKYPEPTITAVTVREVLSVPTAGSDQVRPTLFSAYE